MARINLKSERTSKKFSTRLVQVMTKSDYYELYLSSGVQISRGSLSHVLKVRDLYESLKSNPVQLDLPFIDDPLVVCSVEPNFENLGVEPLSI